MILALWLASVIDSNCLVIQDRYSHTEKVERRLLDTQPVGKAGHWPTPLSNKATVLYFHCLRCCPLRDIPNNPSIVDDLTLITPTTPTSQSILVVESTVDDQPNLPPWRTPICRPVDGRRSSAAVQHPVTTASILAIGMSLKRPRARPTHPPRRVRRGEMRRALPLVKGSLVPGAQKPIRGSRT